MTIPTETMKVGSKGITAALVMQDAAENQGVPAAPPVWHCSDPAIASLKPAENGLSAEILPTGAVGTVTITATVNGSVEITGQINVVPGDVTHGVMLLTPNS